MSDKLLTFVIPAYNTGLLLKDCIQTILDQTYKTFECIIVNDGSTDNTQEVCDDLCRIDQRIRVISKKNEGQSVARNIAVQNANGYYLMFVDSDDYLLPYTAETMIRAMEETNTDAAMCKYFSEEDPPIALSEKLSYEITEAHHFCKKILCDKIGSQLWQFMFKKEQWDGIISPPGRFAQDMMVLHKVVNKMRKLVLLDEYLYHYYNSRSDNTSNSKKNRTKGRFDRSVAFWDRLNFAGENDYADVADVILSNAISFSVRAFSQKDSLSKKYSNDVKKIRKAVKDNYNDIAASKIIPSRKKTAALAIAYAPRLYVFFRTIY